MVPSDNATDPPPYADLARVVAGVAAVEHVGLAVGWYPIVTFEKQLPNMIGNLV